VVSTTIAQLPQNVMARSNLHRPKDKEKPLFSANTDNHKEVFVSFADPETELKEVDKELTPENHEYRPNIVV